MRKAWLVTVTAAALTEALPSLPALGQAGLCFGQRPTIVGTQGNDVITGSSRNDVIIGGGGNDAILGQRGDDVICGGEGHDDFKATMAETASPEARQTTSSEKVRAATSSRVAKAETDSMVTSSTTRYVVDPVATGSTAAGAPATTASSEVQGTTGSEEDRARTGSSAASATTASAAVPGPVPSLGTHAGEPGTVEKTEFLQGGHVAIGPRYGVISASMIPGIRSLPSPPSTCPCSRLRSRHPTVPLASLTWEAGREAAWKQTSQQYLARATRSSLVNQLRIEFVPRLMAGARRGRRLGAKIAMC